MYYGKKGQSFDPNYQSKPYRELDPESSFTSAPQDPHKQYQKMKK